MTTPANERQIGGGHYGTMHGIQHWDLCAMFSLDHFQAAITKYVFRHKKKGGLQDLEKARHYLDKYIELEKTRVEGVHLLVENCGGHTVSACQTWHSQSAGTNDPEQVTCYLCRGYLTSLLEEPDTILTALADDMTEFVDRLHGYLALAKKENGDR